MKITRKDIIEYRKMVKKSWHDEEWHSFMSTPKSHTISYAIEACGSGADYSEIQTACKNNLNLV